MRASRVLISVATVAGILLVASSLGKLGDAVSAAGCGQAQPQFRGRIDLVRLDVSVLDQRRDPVRGLRPDDFTIVDNGREYRPSLFEEVDIPIANPGDDSWESTVAPDVARNTVRSGRLMIILIDDGMVPGPGPDGHPVAMMDYARRAARAVIDRLTPADLAAVVFTNDAGAAQNFTNDRAKLYAAVDKLRIGFRGAYEGTEFAFTDDHVYRNSLTTLKLIAQTLIDGPDRRKALVFISNGVPLSYAAAATTKTGPGPPRAVGGGLVAGGLLEGQIFHSVLHMEILDFFERAQRSNVATYTFPLGGGQDADDFMRSVAENTGGFYVPNLNDPEWGVDRIFLENSNYYVIGYEPAAPPEPGSFRRVDVKVDRPGVTVRSRHGYYTPTPPDLRKATEEDVALREALTSLLPVAEMPMSVHVAPFPLPGGKDTALVVTAELQQASPERPQKQDVELLVTAFDEHGRSRATKRQRATLSLMPANQNARYEVLTRFTLKPGRYNVRFAGHNPALDLSGSVFHDLDVPDFTKDGVHISGVLLAADPGLLSAPRDVLDELVPVVPTTERTFATSTRVVAFARLYQGGRKPIQPVTVSTIIVTSQSEAEGAVAVVSDRSVFDESTTIEPALFAKDRSYDLELAVPLSTLGPGPYLLTIAVASGEAAPLTRHVRFWVK